MLIASNRSKQQLFQEIQAFLQLVVPLCGLELAEAATGFVDTVAIGLLGAQTLAAGALGTLAFYSFVFICRGLLEGITPIAAEAYGAKDPQKLRQIAACGLSLALLLSIPLMFLVWQLDRVFLLLGQDPEIAHLAGTYLDTVAWGLPAAVGFTALREVATAVDRPQTIATVSLIGIGVNAAADYALVLGKWGFPALGLAGVGWASTLVFWALFLSGMAAIAFHPQFREHHLFCRLGFWDWGVMKEILRNGWSIGFLSGAELGLFSAIALLMGYLGTAQLAASEIALQTVEVGLIIPAAIAFAGTSKIGQAMGQKDVESSVRCGSIGFGIAAIAMSIAAVAMLLFPEAIIGIYLSSETMENQAAIAAAVPLLRIAAIFQLAFGLNEIAVGNLMGIQDVPVPILVNTAISCVGGLAAGYLFGFTLEMGGVGLWWGMTLGVMLGSAYAIWRFYDSLNQPEFAFEEVRDDSRIRS